MIIDIIFLFTVLKDTLSINLKYLKEFNDFFYINFKIWIQNIKKKIESH
jgi:hypothetical protein